MTKIKASLWSINLHDDVMTRARAGVPGSITANRVRPVVTRMVERNEGETEYDRRTIRWLVRFDILTDSLGTVQDALNMRTKKERVGVNRK